MPITRQPIVSIPFKRESVSKGDEVKDLGQGTMFQFPSNGKAYPKRVITMGMPAWYQFQFPSNGKAYPKLYSALSWFVLVSLFQFPSNGKAYPKVYFTKDLLPAEGNKFQFPSNGKAYPKTDDSHRRRDESTSFQFPSNGKAYPKQPCSGSGCTYTWQSFNSLQTGKHIQRKMN